MKRFEIKLNFFGLENKLDVSYWAREHRSPNDFQQHVITLFVDAERLTDALTILNSLIIKSLLPPVSFEISETDFGIPLIIKSNV